MSGSSPSALRQLIDTLVPPKEIRVVDVTGAEHVCPAAIPARLQSRATAKLMEILDLPATSASMKGLSGMETASPAEQIQAILGVAKTLMGNEQVLDLVAEVVGIAFPAVIQAATTEAKALGINVKNAADLFEIDQLIGLLSPFIVRLLVGMRDQMAKLLPQ